MIEASFEAVVPKAINAEFEAIIPREKAFDIVNKDIHINTNGKYEVKANDGTAMTQVNVEVDIQPKEFKDVNFYDYEGTILHSYTWDEFVEKNEMPPLPTHREKEGLICQEWNYTLEEVLEQGGRCDVGAIYIPEDGNTHFIINVYKNQFVFELIYSKSQAITIDWGDGVVENIADTDVSTSIFHTYELTGEYDIVISGQYIDITASYPANSLIKVYFGNNINVLRQNIISSRRSLSGVVLKKFTSYNIQAFAVCNIYHLNIPRGMNIGNQIFRDSTFRTLSMPNSVKINAEGVLNNYNIKYLHIPNGATLEGVHFSIQKTNLYNYSVGIGNKMLTCDGNLIISNNNTIISGFKAVVPEGIETIAASAFIGSYTREIKLPKSLKTINYAAFQSCSRATTLIIGDNVTTINTNAFSGCNNISNGVVIPIGIINITANCFNNCIKVPYYDFRNHEAVPTLANTNAFTSISTTCKFVVPDALYDQWIVATNWATYKSRIVKASEFVEPTNNE